MSAMTANTQPSEALITLENIGLTLRDNKVLDNISLSIKPAEIVTLIGPNGGGKSSLVKIMTGLYRADQGQVVTKKGLRIGYMPQRLNIEATMPINTHRFLSLSNRNAKRVEYFIARLNLDSLCRTPLQSLSGGEMQRVLLARALLREPEILILDEPMQGVDVAGQSELYKLIGELRDELGCAVFMVSHDLHLVMAATDTVVCLNHHICCNGKPEHVSQHPEYIDLFGQEHAKSIAIYTHTHDHEHDLHGDVVGGEGDSENGDSADHKPHNCGGHH